jgi:hypothetical protein
MLSSSPHEVAGVEVRSDAPIRSYAVAADFRTVLPMADTIDPRRCCMLTPFPPSGLRSVMGTSRMNGNGLARLFWTCQAANTSPPTQKPTKGSHSPPPHLTSPRSPTWSSSPRTAAKTASACRAAALVAGYSSGRTLSMSRYSTLSSACDLVDSPVNLDNHTAPHLRKGAGQKGPEDKGTHLAPYCSQTSLGTWKRGVM